MTTAPALQPVIVGAGPAGIRAAQTLAAHGVRPVLIDEAYTELAVRALHAAYNLDKIGS